MGYTCSYWGDLTIKKGSFDEVRRMMKDPKTKEFFEDTGARLELNGSTQSLSFGDSSKYREEYFIPLWELLRGHVTGIIEFRGEDDEHWRFKFDDDGNWTEEGGVIIYGDQYDQFRLEYDHRLTPELKKALDKWWTSTKI